MQAENGEYRARPLSETTPVTADVLSSLGMIREEQQLKSAANAIQKKNDAVVINSPASSQTSEATPIAEDESTIHFQPQDPIKSKEWYNEGIDLLNRGNYAEATKAFEAAISYDANNTAAWENYWDIYWSTKYGQEPRLRFQKMAVVKLSGGEGEEVSKELQADKNTQPAPTPVSNSQETNEEELRKKLQYINSWFAAGAPGLS